MVINEGHILGPWQVEPRHAMAPTRCPPSHDTQAKVVKGGDGLVSDDLIYPYARTYFQVYPAFFKTPAKILSLKITKLKVGFQIPRNTRMCMTVFFRF